MQHRLVAAIVAILLTPATALAANDDQTSREPEHARIGALAAAGFPRPISFEAMLKLERVVAFGAEYGFLPSVSIGGVTTTARAIAADLRVFPFRGAFFVGARAGHQHLGASTTVTVASYGSLAESIDVDAWFVNPRIGFLWTWASGLSLGVDAGVQLPVTASTSSTIPNGVQGVGPIVDTTNALGRGVLPTVNLLSVGLLL